MYLGHSIDTEGFHTMDDKLSAILDVPAPNDVSALKSFLGLIMFYSQFLSNHSTVFGPLNRSLKKDVHWGWTDIEHVAISKSKKMLLESHTPIL